MVVPEPVGRRTGTSGTFQSDGSPRRRSWSHLCVRLDDRTHLEVHVGAHAGPRTDGARICRAPFDDGALADDRVDQVGFGAEHASGTDDGRSLEHRARKQRHVGVQLDGTIDIGRRRVDHRDPGPHPRLVDPGPQDRLGAGELHPVVHPPGLCCILHGVDGDGVSGGRQQADHVGEIHLTLGVVGTHLCQRLGEQGASKAVDGRVHLGDGPLLGRGVGIFDDLEHLTVRGADDASVAGGVVQSGGQQGRRRTPTAMGRHQSGERPGPEERCIAGHHDHIAFVARVQGPQTAGHGVAGAELLFLDREGHGDLVGVLGELAGQPIGMMADHHHDRCGGHLDQRVQDIPDHRAATEQMQRLGTGRPHPSALPGREDDRTQGPLRSVHLPWSSGSRRRGDPWNRRRPEVRES